MPAKKNNRAFVSVGVSVPLRDAFVAAARRYTVPANTLLRYVLQDYVASTGRQVAPDFGAHAMYANASTRRNRSATAGQRTHINLVVSDEFRQALHEAATERGTTVSDVARDYMMRVVAEPAIIRQTVAAPKRPALNAEQVAYRIPRALYDAFQAQAAAQHVSPSVLLTQCVQAAGRGQLDVIDVTSSEMVSPRMWLGEADVTLLAAKARQENLDTPHYVGAVMAGYLEENGVAPESLGLEVVPRGPRHTLPETAQLLGVHPRTLDLYIREGTVPAPKKFPGRVYSYTTAEVEAMRASLALPTETGDGYTQAAVAQMVGVSSATLHHSVKSGRIPAPAITVGNRRVFAAAQLDTIRAFFALRAGATDRAGLDPRQRVTVPQAAMLVGVPYATLNERVRQRKLATLPTKEPGKPAFFFVSQLDALASELKVRRGRQEGA